MISAGASGRGGEARRAALWAAAGALAALAAVALAAAAPGPAAPAGEGAEPAGDSAGAPAAGGSGGEPGVSGGDGGAASGGGGEVGRGGEEEPDVVMPNKSSRPGCEKSDACYVPPAVQVAAGGSVTWRNDDVAFHTVTSGEYGSPDGAFDSGHLDPGEEFAVTFAEAGEVGYHCTLHPWMVGRVIVEPQGAGGGGAAEGR